MLVYITEALFLTENRTAITRKVHYNFSEMIYYFEAIQEQKGFLEASWRVMKDKEG